MGVLGEIVGFTWEVGFGLWVGGCVTRGGLGEMAGFYWYVGLGR